MNARITKLGRFIGIGVLTFGLLGQSGCDEAAKQCGLTCPDNGVADGNASITGYIAIDSFFQSVVNFKGVANTVSADIAAELDGIRGAFGISPAEVETAGNLGAAIRAKLQAQFSAKLVVDAQPPKCEVDASLTVEATAKCQAEANCDVTKPTVKASCEGTCSVEVMAQADCSAEATVTCAVSAPSFECKGSCEGTCTATLEAGAACNGKCDGTCSVALDSEGNCGGSCSGSCELTGMAALNCNGSCNGTCTYEPGMASCDARAKVECKTEASAEVECSGKCDGEFTPPKVDCDASASCEASAKADAKFQAKCTPPSVDVRFDVAVSAGAQAQADFLIGELKARLPRLLAALKKADLVVDAGTQLVADGKGAISGSIDALASGDVDAVAKYRIATCAPTELTAAGTAITNSGKGLAAQVEASAQVTAALGM